MIINCHKQMKLQANKPLEYIYHLLVNVLMLLYKMTASKHMFSCISCEPIKSWICPPTCRNAWSYLTGQSDLYVPGQLFFVIIMQKK